MEENLVSIITPCYNGSKYIGETINSVLAQTYQDWEMIIVDDGSKDNSVEVIEEFTKKDERIKLIKQPNGGSANARNNGIRNAKGRYIALLDADDLWDNNFLEEQLKFMKEKDVVLVYGSYRRIDENSTEILRPIIARKKATYKDMQRMCYIGCLTGFYDSKKYGKVYLREELKSIRDDYAYWMDIMKFEGVAYGNPKVLASYRVLVNSTTGKKAKLIKAQYNFYRHYLKLGFFRSVYNTIYWGCSGIFKFFGVLGKVVK